MSNINAIGSEQSNFYNPVMNANIDTDVGINNGSSAASLDNSMALLTEMMTEMFSLMDAAQEKPPSTTSINTTGSRQMSYADTSAANNSVDALGGVGMSEGFNDIMEALRPLVDVILGFARSIDPRMGNEIAQDFNENLPEGWAPFEMVPIESSQTNSNNDSQNSYGKNEASGGGCGCGCSGPGCSCGGGCGSGGHHAGALSEPRFESEAPSSLVSSLGSWVDGEGNVRAANNGQHSGHAGHEMGTEINVHEVYEAALAAGIDADAFIANYISNGSNFNPGQTSEQKHVGALTVLNDMTAAVTMGGLEGNSTEIAKIAGAATSAALNGDATALRRILEGAGGNVENMSDDMLLNVWGTNSHMYNHSILAGSSEGFALSHLRSLNDRASDGTAKGTLGFYNDKGAYPQWDAQQAANNFVNKMVGNMGSGSRSAVSYAGSTHH